MKIKLIVIIGLLAPLIMKSQVTDSIPVEINITSTDLSEDMSSLSSGNDELLLIAYTPIENGILNPPVIIKEFVFNEAVKEIKFLFYVSNKFEKKDLLFFLIEQDSKASIKRIEAGVRIYQKEIIALHQKKKTTELEEYLGDEDLLIANSTLLFRKMKSIVKGNYIQNLDRYNYELSVIVY